MNENEQKQQLSFAFIHAISARAGLWCEQRRIDDDSVDVMIGRRGKVRNESYYTSPVIEVQVKATCQDILKEDHLAFPLPLKNYNDLRGRSVNPRYLVVFLLPKDPLLWIVQEPERMISRSCAYYTSLRGAEETENISDITVYLPKENALNVRSLEDLVFRASRRNRL